MRKPISNRRFGKSCFSAPCRAALGFPEASYVNCASCVLPLLKRGFPPAIIWEIVPVIFLSSQGVLGSDRFRSHVREKVFEPVFSSPSVTNENASPAVVRITTAPLVVASVHHAIPAIKSGRILVASCKSMGRSDFRYGLALEAAARLSVAVAQVPDANDGIFSAIAPAKPIGHVTSSMVYFCSDKSPKTLIGEGKEFRHNAGFSIFAAGIKDGRKLRPAMNAAFGNDPIRPLEMQAA